jgi:exoribonuclease II
MGLFGRKKEGASGLDPKIDSLLNQLDWTVSRMPEVVAQVKAHHPLHSEDEAKAIMILSNLAATLKSEVPDDMALQIFNKKYGFSKKRSAALVEVLKEYNAMFPSPSDY